jgi:AhpD family alkylhydroperoxidase
VAAGSSSSVMNTNIANLNEPRLNYRKVSPTVLQALWGVQKAVDSSGLERSLLELIKLRASQLNGCAFCIDMHYRDALKAGEAEQRLFLLNAWEEAPVYTPRERAALRWTEALTKLAGHGVSEELYEAVRAEFSETELVSLTLAVVAINSWNRFSVGFRVPPGFTL